MKIVYLLLLFSLLSLAQNKESQVIIDLNKRSLMETSIGKSASKHQFKTANNYGVETGVKNGVLDYFFIELSKYTGLFRVGGDLLDFGRGVRKRELMAWFGEPYWTDHSNGEMIMFYLYDKGTTEVQYEFSDGKTLSHITVLKNGILSDPEERKAYGITKAYPH